MTYMDFDPSVIRERNQQMLREVHSLRLEEQLQANHGGRRFWPEDLVAVVGRLRRPPAPYADRRWRSTVQNLGPRYAKGVRTDEDYVRRR